MLISIFVLIGVQLVRFEAERYKQQELENAQKTLDDMRVALADRIYENIHKISSVKPLIAMNPDLSQEDFARAMDIQFRGEQDLRNIGLARDMVLQFMYPIKGNEAAIGLDYTTIPEQFEAVDLARRLNKIVLAGPVTLVQGGEGIIARIPIYISETASNQEQFWGFASVVMNIETIIAGAGIIEKHGNLSVAIRGRDAKGPEGDIFFGDPAVFDGNPVTHLIELPHGSWQIGVIPSAGWSTHTLQVTPLIWAYMTVVITTLVFTAVIFNLLLKMNKTENERDFFVSSLEIFLKQTGDFIYYKDANSRFVFSSQTLAEITNHKHWKDMIGKHDFEVFPHDVALIYNEEEESVFNEGKPLLNKVNPYYSENGEIGYVMTNKWPVFDDNNNVSGIFGISRDITEHKKAVDALEKERNLFAEGPVFTMEWDSEPYDEWPVKSASSNIEKILGYSPAEMMHPDFSYSELIHPEDMDDVIKELKNNIEKHIDLFEQSYRLKTKAGHYIWVYDFSMLVRNDIGSLISIRSYMYDETAKKRTEEALQIAEAKLEKTAYELTENIPVGTYTMVQPASGGMANFVFMSRRFLELMGLTREEVGADPLKPFSCLHPDDLEEFMALNVRSFEEKSSFYAEARIIVENEEVRWITAESTPRTLLDGTTVWEGVLIDITDRKRDQEKLRRMATIDGLSELNNRSYFMELSNKEFKMATIKQEEFAVLILDIDKFKLVNDKWGHAAGDTVISEVGRLIREYFNKANIAGRLGGEEFGVLIQKCSIHEAVEIANGFRERLAQAVIVYDNETIKITISIGVSGYVPNVESFSEILRCADEALYQSKVGGRNCVSARECLRS